jgi:hypothetical protein
MLKAIKDLIKGKSPSPIKFPVIKFPLGNVQIELEEGIWLIMPEKEYKAEGPGKSKKEGSFSGLLKADPLRKKGEKNATEKVTGNESGKQGEDCQGPGQSGGN